MFNRDIKIKMLAEAVESLGNARFYYFSVNKKLDFAMASKHALGAVQEDLAQSFADELNESISHVVKKYKSMLTAMLKSELEEEV